ALLNPALEVGLRDFVGSVEQSQAGIGEGDGRFLDCDAVIGDVDRVGADVFEEAGSIDDLWCDGSARGRRRRWSGLPVGGLSLGSATTCASATATTTTTSGGLRGRGVGLISGRLCTLRGRGVASGTSARSAWTTAARASFRTAVLDDKRAAVRGVL